MELIRKGKRLKGAYAQTTNSLIYVAFQTPGDFCFRGKSGTYKSIAHAYADGNLALGIDDETLMSAKRRGANYVAVYIRKLKWYFMVEIEALSDSKLYFRDHHSIATGRYRFLPTQHWQQLNCPEQFR